jgi:formylglycine-generating enzyme required for sulfatase activity
MFTSAVSFCFCGAFVIRCAAFQDEESSHARANIPQLALHAQSPDRDQWTQAAETLGVHARQSRELQDEIWERTRVNTVGMKFVPIMPGEFLSGWPVPQPKPVREAFFLSACEVTNEQMKTVLPDWTASDYSPDPHMPALGVDCQTALRFCAALSEAEKASYRLPSDPEWEYACRAGSSTAWGVETPIADHACWKEGGLKQACTVASFPPNSWGLYDMHGNALEWVRPRSSDDADGCAGAFRGGAFAAGVSDALRCSKQIPLPLFDCFPLDLDCVPFRQAIGFRVVREIRSSE